jgi:hypothetical protein
LRTTPSQIVRGRPLRVLLGVGGVLGAAMTIFCVWIWSTDEPRTLKLAAVLLLITFAVLATAALTLAAALTSARVDGDCLRFTICGVTARRIQLDAISGYERPFGPGSPVRIIYGTSWYCPNGLLEADDVVDLLRSHGVAEQNAA